MSFGRRASVSTQRNSPTREAALKRSPNGYGGEPLPYDSLGPNPSGEVPLGHISPERLVEYKAIIRRVYGQDISDEEALDQIHRLRALYRAILGPISEAPVDSNPPTV